MLPTATISPSPYAMSKTDKAKTAASAILHGHNPQDALHAVAQKDRGGATAASIPKSGSGGRLKPSPVSIPKQDFTDHAAATDPKTPKTPADEGIEFFEHASIQAPIQVYELRLDPDGGPNKDRSVCPVATISNRELNA